MMELLPAIDLRGGLCVRLLRGDYRAETVYGDDPIAVARAYEAAGARWIHMVDLDAARTGERVNAPVIAAVCRAVSCSIEVGGGVRSVDVATALIGDGVARVVIGTAAVQEPRVVSELCDRFPGQIAVGLDARGRDVSVHGWQESTGDDVVALAGRFDELGVSAVIATQIERDGVLSGPDLDLYQDLLGVVRNASVIASGGVGSLEHLRTLDAMNVDGRRLAGVIVGRALYEGMFDVEEAIACLRPV